MGDPAPKPFDRSRILSLEDLEEKLALLPARQQADLKWTRPVIQKALQSVQAAMPTPEILATGTTDLLRVWHRLLPLVGALQRDVGDGALANSIRAAAAQVDAEKLARIATLRSYLGEESAGDSAEGALRAVVEWLRLTNEIMAERPIDEVVQRLAEIDIPALTRSEEGGLPRAQLLLMALLDAAGRQVEIPHAADLAHLAYLEAQRGVRSGLREGLRIEPYADESTAERNARAVRSIEQLRRDMTDDFQTTVFPADDSL